MKPNVKLILRLSCRRREIQVHATGATGAGKKMLAGEPVLSASLQDRVSGGVGAAPFADSVRDEQAGQRAQTKADAEHNRDGAQRLTLDAISRFIHQVFSRVTSASGCPSGRSHTVLDSVIDSLLHALSRHRSLSHLRSRVGGLFEQPFLCDFFGVYHNCYLLWCSHHFNEQSRCHAQNRANRLQAGQNERIDVEKREWQREITQQGKQKRQ
jgi:hypothetical protein